MTLELAKYGAIISDQLIGDEIYHSISSKVSKGLKCIVDCTGVKSMATFNAKQIFGRLYLELGAEKFFDLIEIRLASDDLKIIIRLGIQSAMEDLSGDS